MRPFLLALGLLASVHVQAQSLAGALERAWQRVPQAQSQPDRQAGLAAEQKAAAMLFSGPPTIAVGHQTDRYDRNSGAREFEAELAAPVWLPGQRAAAAGVAAASSAQYGAEQQALRLQLAGELREAVWRVALAENAVRLAQSRLQADRQVEADVGRRVAAGDLARTDLLLASGETAAAQAALVEAEQTLLEAIQQYAQLVGDRAVPPRARELVPADYELDKHPALLAAARRAEAAAARARLTSRSGRENPELAFTARRERGDANEAYGNRVGVALKIPLGSSARNEARAANAQADLTEAEVTYRRERIAREQEVERAQAALRSALQLSELSATRHALARETHRLTKAAFDLGEKSLFEFQRVQNMLDAAALAASQASLEVDRAHARLNQALGVLP